jgi:NDP-4-keto-2,6-dideoxyhexose 3-C-methyltransferase
LILDKERNQNITITHCRSCKSANLEFVLTLGNIYLADWRDDDKKPPSFPLTLYKCTKCHLVQLGNSVPSKLLYNDHYGYRSGTNQTMRDHLKGIVNSAVGLVSLSKGDSVLDIGSNDSTLLKNYSNPNIIRIGFDPVEKFKSDYYETGIEFVNDFFSSVAFRKRFGKLKVKVITAISMFYDLDDPNTFVAGLGDLLEDDGIVIIQQNYLVKMLEQNAFCNICHEHVEFYSLLAMSKLLKQHNFEVFSVETNDLNGGSFRTYICKKGKRKIDESVRKMQGAEKELKVHLMEPYSKFAHRIDNIARNLHSYINGLHQDSKRIYVYGASTRGNTLLQYAHLDQHLLEKAVERNPEKVGKVFASVGIPIISENQARTEKPDYMLVLPWFFKEEFLNREADYMKNGGHLIFPLPQTEVYPH